MKKNFFLLALTAFVALGVLTACEEEEETAQALNGVWETTDVMFTRTYKGQTMTPTKTVIRFDQERNTSLAGWGVAVEYFNNPDIPIVYHTIKWEVWHRKDGSVGVEWYYQETRDKFKTTDYKLNDKEFSGICSLNDADNDKKRITFHRGTMPDVSKVEHWGYNELLPTWHQVTFEGKIFIQREYQGKVYEPKNVVITFDCEPVYNTGMVDVGKAFIKEEYDDAPWGTYLADSIKFWDYWKASETLRIHRNDGYDPYNCDYELMYIERTDSELKGKMFIRTNVFEPFTLRRIANPDWSTIKNWGFSKWFPKTN